MQIPLPLDRSCRPPCPHSGSMVSAVAVADIAAWGDTERRHEIAEFSGGKLRRSLRHHQTEARATAHGGADARRIPANLLHRPDQPDLLDALRTAPLGSGSPLSYVLGY